MEPFIRPLTGTARPEHVLRRLSERARRKGLAPPAALTGDWFHGSAVLAPSVRVTATPDADAFSKLDTPAHAEHPGGAVGGGWIGYLGYGLTDPGQHPEARRLPQAAWGWADHVLRRDADGQWWFESIGAPDPRTLCEELQDAVSATGSPPARPPKAGSLGTPDAEHHRKAVRACVEEIAAGEIFQANICSRFTVDFDGSPLELFAAGSERFQPARAAYVAGAWGAVASLSPELFLARRGGVVRSSPIKGTLPRRGPADDGNAALLRSSTKDVAENVMIVDMARNDLGRVAEVGKVTVERLLDVQPHPGVWHLVSDVRAGIPADLPNSELLGATFPPASVTGAPKLHALDIIAELEAHPREIYCGSVGMMSPLAGLELNVAIRTWEHADGVLHLGVGGGITADSDPEQEWQECLTKAAPMLDLVNGGSLRTWCA